MGNVLASDASELFDAISSGDAETAVKALAAHPVLSHKRVGPKNRTVFHACATHGQTDVLKRLCQYIWRTVPDEFGKIHGDTIPEGRPHPTIYQAINSYDQMGSTPLILACRKGHAQTVECLLSQGADPWIADRMLARSPLHYAARANFPSCIEVILTCPFIDQVGKVRTREHALVNFPSSCGYTPLHYAATSRGSEAAAVLLRFGGNPNAKNWDIGFDFIQLEEGSTPMHAAARFQNLEMAVEVLKYWQDSLKAKDVTDPRVVENSQRVKPYQASGVAANKALLRVLNPATLIKEITDPFGETESRPAAVARVPSTKTVLVQPSRSQRINQERTVSRSSGEEGWPAGEKIPAGWEDLIPSTGAAKGAPRQMDAGSEFMTVYRCPEFVAERESEGFDGTPGPVDPVPGPGVGFRGAAAATTALTRSQSDGRSVLPPASSLTPPKHMSRTRSGAVVQGGSLASSGSHPAGTPAAALQKAPSLHIAPVVVPRSQSGTYREPLPSRGFDRTSPVSVCDPGPASPTPASGRGCSGPSPTASDSSSLTADGAPLCSPRLQPVTPPKVDSSAMTPAAAAAAAERTSTLFPAASMEGRMSVDNRPGSSGSDASGPWTGGPVGTMTRTSSGRLMAKPPSPPDKATGGGAGRTLTKTLSKKLSTLTGSGSAVAALPATSTAVTAGTTGAAVAALSRKGSGAPPVTAAWAEPGAQPACAARARSSKQPSDTPELPCFTRDSHAEDGQNVEVTMYPHIRVNLQTLKKGDTCNALEAGDCGPQKRTSRDGRTGARDQQAVSGTSGRVGEGLPGDSPFSLSRQGLMPSNELPEDESRQEPALARTLAPSNSRKRF